MSLPLPSLIGQRFGRLTVIGKSEPRKRRSYWLCQCDCGNTKIIEHTNLRRGLIQSCRCLHREIATANALKHGHSSGGRKTAEYCIWKTMKQRCSNPKSCKWKDYGGRGITVCDRWNSSFENFIADMGPRPSPDHSIDRADNEKGYSPDNCRWASRIEQANNTRWNSRIEFLGQIKTAAEWEREMGFRPKTLTRRGERGWTTEQSLLAPTDSRLKTYQGKSLPFSEWAKITGVPLSTLEKRVRRGWSLERALTTPRKGST